MPSLYQSCSARTAWPEVPTPLCLGHSPTTALCVVATAFLHILASRLSVSLSHLSSEVLKFLHKVPTGLDPFLVSHNLIPTSRLISCVWTGSWGRRALSLVNNLLLLPGISISPANLAFHQPQQRSLILHSLMPSFRLFPLSIMSVDPSRLLFQRLPICEVFSGSEVGFFWIRVSGFACLPG